MWYSRDIEKQRHCITESSGEDTNTRTQKVMGPGPALKSRKHTTEAGCWGTATITAAYTTLRSTRVQQASAKYSLVIESHPYLIRRILAAMYESINKGKHATPFGYVGILPGQLVPGWLASTAIVGLAASRHFQEWQQLLEVAWGDNS